MSVSLDVGVRRSFVAAALLLSMLVAAGPVRAQDEPAGSVTIELQAGLAGFVDPAQPTSVVADITADELFVGVLVARVSGRNHVAAVEVPAGSTKRYVLELPAMGRSRQITVNLRRVDEQGEVVLTETLRVSTPRNQLLVGVVAADAAEAPIRAAKTNPAGREVVAIAMDPALLASDAYSVVRYLVVGPGALADLDESSRTDLERWITRGGRLYGTPAEVAALAAIESGERIPGTPVLVTRAGKGEIGAMDDPAALTVEEWSSLLRDVGSIEITRNDAPVTALSTSLLAAATSGREASVPAVPWLLAGIVLFVVLIGPVNFLVLRWVKRPEFAWLTVPVLSAIFVAGFWLIGRGQIADFTVGHGSVLVAEYGVVEGTGGFVLQTESGGRHELAFPANWEAASLSGSGLNVVGTPTGTDTRPALTYEMEALGVAAAEASWFDADLAVATSVARSTDGLTFDVSNDTPWTYWLWGVVVNGRAVAGEGTLAPGAAGQLTAGVGRASTNLYEPLLAQPVSRQRYQEEGRERYEIAYPLASIAEVLITDLRATDLFFFGYTADRSVPVDLDDRSGEALGTTLVVTRMDPPPEVAFALGRAQPEIISVVGASTVEQYGNDIYLYGAEEVYLRYQLPELLPPAARVTPGFTSFQTVEAYDWTTASFLTIQWGTEFPLDGVVSPTGEVVLRALADREDFFDDTVNLDRFALTWSTS